MIQAHRQRNEEEQREGNEPFFKPTNVSAQESQQSFFLFNNDNNNCSGSATSNSGVSLFQDTQSSVTTSASQHERTNSSFLLLTPNIGRTSNATPTTTPTMQQRQTQQVQALTTQHTQQKNSETSAQRNDRLSSLHSRLHQEADKIRRWKVQTEIDQKQKERHLKESEETIEHQRKAVVDLQLQNEMLSVKLQEEIENRTEIMQKIETTRDMCNLLKEYTTKVEDRLSTCERDRDELKVDEQVHIKEFQDLDLKFKDLSLVHVNKLNDLTVQFEEERKYFHESEKQLQSQVKGAEKKVDDLCKQYEEKEFEIQQLAAAIQQNNLQISLLQKEKGCIQQTLVKTEATVSSQKEKLDQAHRQIQDMEQQNNTLLHIKKEQEKKLEEFKGEKTELEVTVEELKQHITELSSEKEILQSNVQRAKETLTDKQIEHEQAMAQTQATNEAANQEMDMVRISLSNLETEKKQLKDKITSLTEKLQDIIEDQQQTLNKLQTTEQALQKKEADMLLMRRELKEVLEREKTSYDKIDILKQDKKAESAENGRLTELLEYARNQKQVMEQKFQTRKDEMEQLQANIQDMKSCANTEGMKLETVVTDNQELQKKVDLLESTLKEQDTSSFDLLEQEKKMNETLTKEAKLLTEQCEMLESKKKSIQGQLTSKNKANKELEKENKSLKSKHTTESKQKVALQEKLEEIKIELEKKDETVSTFKGDTLNLKEETQKAVKEHNDAKKKCEHQMAEVSATLNKYKADNEKIVTLKEKEIEQLKQKLEEALSSTKTEKKELADTKKEIHNFKEVSAQYDTANNALQKELEKQKTIAEQIRKELQEKASTIKELKEKLEKKVKAVPEVKPPTSPPVCAIVPATPKSQSSTAPQNYIRKTPALTRTPKNPLTPMTPMTPSYTKTPQRSILRQATSSAKKRRVAFEGDSDLDDDTDSDSSTSQLMEIEIDDVDAHLEACTGDRKVPSQAVLPLRVKPSPRPPSITLDEERHSKLLKPVPRGKPAQKQKKIKEQDMMDVSEEVKQFKQLYPDNKEADCMYQDKKSKMKKPSKLRQTPSKANSLKNFRESPRSQNRKKKTKNKAAKSQEDLSWFESDAVFGFFDDD